MSVQAQADVFLKYYTYVFNKCMHSVHTSKESAIFQQNDPLYIHVIQNVRKFPIMFRSVVEYEMRLMKFYSSNNVQCK